MFFWYVRIRYLFGLFIIDNMVRISIIGFKLNLFVYIVVLRYLLGCVIVVILVKFILYLLGFIISNFFVDRYDIFCY